MATERNLGIADAPFVEAADLTGKQYYFVRAGSVVGEVNTATGASNPIPIGVLQNALSAGQEARVRMIGPTKLVGEAATCNLVYGKFFLSASDGQAEAMATAAGSPICGVWLDATLSSGSAIGQAFFFPSWGACAVAAS